MKKKKKNSQNDFKNKLWINIYFANNAITTIRFPL